MSNNSPKALISESNQAVVSAIAGELPVLGSVVEITKNIWKRCQINRLEKFLSTTEIDEIFLKNLATKENEQELFLEYIQCVVNTPNPLACITLALIYKDPNIGESLKSLCANTFKGISQGTLNIFCATIEHLDSDENNDREQFIRLRNNQQGSVYISPRSIGLVKDQIEILAFTNDLVSRNFCTKGSVISDDGSTIAINSFSLLLYDFIEKAKLIQK